MRTHEFLITQSVGWSIIQFYLWASMSWSNITCTSFGFLLTRWVLSPWAVHSLCLHGVCPRCLLISWLQLVCRQQMFQSPSMSMYFPLFLCVDVWDPLPTLDYKVFIISAVLSYFVSLSLHGCSHMKVPIYSWCKSTCSSGCVRPSLCIICLYLQAPRQIKGMDLIKRYKACREVSS